jgi:hypothetical protein
MDPPPAPDTARPAEPPPSSPEPAPAAASGPAAAVVALARSRWLRRLIPWISLATGIAGALMMDRGPKRGTGVAVAALGIWLVLLVQQWLARVEAPAGGIRARVVWVAKLSSLFAAQSLLQLNLFFALPFYLRAADLHDPGHVAFLVLLIVLGAASLWDPLTEALFARPRLGAWLPAVSSFVALAAVLPGLHLSTQHSLWIAAGVAGSGAAITLQAGTRPGARVANLPLVALLVRAIPLALWLGALRVVPAAPLRLASVDFGAQLVDRWVTAPLRDGAAVPARLYCATAIWAPLGVRDRLFHVWTKDGKPRVRVELAIRGGRGAGFRTFSRITPGRGGSGRYRCSVETASGQVLGSKALRLSAGPRGPATTPQ